MKNVTEIFSNPLAQTLGWTLVHSLWQILAITLVYFLVILFTKKANVRYWTGMSLLALQFLGSIITFTLIFQLSAAEKTFNGVAIAPKMLTSVQLILNYLQTNLHLIVGLWVVGCLILFSRLMLGYFWVNQLKNNPKNEMNPQLSEVLVQLKTKMGISKNVDLKISSIVSLPMIMGVFKPVILMPMSLVTGFSKEQLETILAHELAHFKRHDFLFNGLQSVLDVLYFFHPAMWVLSAQIRKERENCCDDLALEVSGNKILLAKTLVQLQETAYTPKLALAFGKKSYSLLERVQRIIGVNQSKNFNKESVWIVVGLFVTFFAFAQKTSEKKTEPKSSFSKIALADTVINPAKDEHNFVIQNNKHDFRIKDNKVFFDGKPVELTPDVQVLVDQRIKAIESNKLQIEKQSKLIEEQSKKIGDYASKMNVHSEPMGEVGKKMGEIGQKMDVVSKKFEAELRAKGLTDKEYKAIEKKFEKEMAEFEAQMEEYGKQMEVHSNQMEEFNEPMNALSAQIDELAEPMEAISEQIEKNVDEIIELLPADIKSKIEKERQKAPRPPKPPKAMKGMVPPPPPPAPKAPKGRVSKVAPEDVPVPPTPPSPKSIKELPTPPKKNN